MTPAARTLALLKDEGKLVQSVERYNSFSKTRKDLFGFIDIIAIEPGVTWGIQCTTKASMSAHYKKICTECEDEAIAWLEAGNRIELIGWYEDLTAWPRWTAIRREITMQDLIPYDDRILNNTV